MLVIAHLSDLHVGGHPGADERVARVLAYLAAFEPAVDVVLVTGDVADHGTAEEYALTAELFEAWPGPAPVLWCPGNHDVREGYAVLRGLPLDGRPCDEVHDVGGVRFVMLDSLVPAPPGERIDPGALAPPSIARLDEALAGRAPGQWALVCLHHPPVDIHVGLMDPIKLLDAVPLTTALGRHERVAGVLVGHAHTACAATYAGLPLRIGGAVASTVPFTAEPQPVITHDLGPSFAVHVLADDGSLVTHWRTLSPGP